MNAFLSRTKPTLRKDLVEHSRKCLLISVYSCQPLHSCAGGGGLLPRQSRRKAPATWLQDRHLSKEITRILRSSDPQQHGRPSWLDPFTKASNGFSFGFGFGDLFTTESLQCRRGPKFHQTRQLPAGHNMAQPTLGSTPGPGSPGGRPGTNIQQAAWYGVGAHAHDPKSRSSKSLGGPGRLHSHRRERRRSRHSWMTPQPRPQP
jgi:hypothetical protein